MTPNLAQPSDLTPAQIEARLAAATPGPWRPVLANNSDSHWGVAVEGRDFPSIAYAHAQYDGYGNGSTKADADLIANAPTDLAYLLAENKRLRAGITEALSSLNTALGVTNMREWVEGVRLDLTTLNGETDD